MNFVQTKVGKLQALNDSSGYKNPTKVLTRLFLLFYVTARPFLIHHTIYSSDQCDDQQRYLAPPVDVGMLFWDKLKVGIAPATSLLQVGTKAEYKIPDYIYCKLT